MKNIVLLTALFASINAFVGFNSQAQSTGGNATNCPPASISSIEINAILTSDKIAAAYPDAGSYLSSFTNSIVRVPEKTGTYIVTTSYRDGTNQFKFEVNVIGAQTCYTDKAKVISVIRKE